MMRGAGARRKPSLQIQNLIIVSFAALNPVTARREGHRNSRHRIPSGIFSERF
jgi:hypothetical protein